MTNYFRNVHSVLGLPIDAITMQRAVERLQQARSSRQQCFFSTPNLNFAVAAQDQAPFRESVCKSDLSLPDGMPIVWVSRLLGIPVHERVSGSDLFDALRAQNRQLWRVFFFGGQKGVGQEACLAIGAQQRGVLPTGYIYPGFVNARDMSSPELLQCINQSQPDMVVVSLGAAKGQEWICRNRNRIEAPVIAHLGAVINFVAGNVHRAPAWMRRTGLEWLWRIKEESTLLQRYLRDGLRFLVLLATQVLPLALHQAVCRPDPWALQRRSLQSQDAGDHTLITLHGGWSAGNLHPLRLAFTTADAAGKPVVLDLAATVHIDSAFVALLLLLDQSLRDRGLALQLRHVSTKLRLYLRWSGVQHLEIA